MREVIKDKGRLEHILYATNNIFEFIKDKSQDNISTEKILFYAIVKNIEIIGEVAYMLTLDFREKHTDTNWGKL